MTIDDQIKMKNCNTILIEKQPKNQLNHRKKLVSMNIEQEKKHYHLIKNKKIEQGTFTYYPLGKVFEKQIKTIEYQC